MLVKRLEKMDMIKKKRENLSDNTRVKKDCFAFHKNGCAVLTETLCACGKCGFYKTKEEQKRDLKKYPRINYAKYLRERGVL